MHPRARSAISLLLAVSFAGVGLLVAAGCGKARKHAARRPIDAGLLRLQDEYLDAYHVLYSAGLALKTEIVGLVPPETHEFSTEDLEVFSEMLESLYTRRPSYRQEYPEREAARHIAAITGLPLTELGRYQDAAGTYGLRQLTLSVQNLPHKEWVVLYFRLIGVPSAEDDYCRQPPAAFPSVALEGKWLAFYEAGRRFVAIRDELLARTEQLLRTETDSTMKCQVATKRLIYRTIAQAAGQINVFGELAGAYPLSDVPENRYEQAWFISDRLNLDYLDLAYVQQRKGITGLRDLLAEFQWVEGVDDIINDVEW